jgi:predicted DNA-binding protein YlxM (UPF0122 family)
VSEAVRLPSKAEQLEFRPRGEFFFFDGDARVAEQAMFEGGGTFRPLVGSVPGIQSEYALTAEQLNLRERVEFVMHRGLTDNQYALLRKVFWEGRTISAIAREEQVSRQAVHKRFLKAKKAMALMLDALYGEYEHVKRGYGVTADELLDRGDITPAEYAELKEVR